MSFGQLPLKHILQSLWVHRLLRWILGGLFIYAGALKLSDPAAFAIQLEKYGVLPAAWLDPAAWGLPLVELVAGGAALLGRRGGAESLGLLLLMFLAALGHAWWSGLDIPCGCFSIEDEQHHYAIQLTIFRDLLLLAGVVWLLVWRRRFVRQGTHRRAERPGST